MALSVYGKHPAKGDFVESGLPAGLKPVVEGWLDAVLAETRHALGDAWEQAWPAAPALRFWLGEAIWGEPVCGVLMTSADRVGRRFPLVIFASGAEAAALPAPAIAPDQIWYDRIEAHLRAALQRDLALPADLLAGIAPPEANPDTPAAGPVDFWAVRPGSGVAGLLADIALTDHRRAAMGRSYWWVAGQDPAPEPEADQQPEPVIAPEPEPEPDPMPEPEPAPPPVETSAWDLPDTDDSPFAAPSGPSLFAAPEAADPDAPLLETHLVILPPTPPRVLWSQVWAGEGLPSGHVLAWFLRGYDGTA